MHFAKSTELDENIRDRFSSTYLAALNGETAAWRSSPEGRLAEIIVLDQFSRNMFRDTPKAFASDALSLRLAREAVTAGDDKKLPVAKRAFIYMPYMHSEDLEAHREAVTLFSEPGLEFNLKFELMHKAIIDRFGRYPHRNQILGRVSTAAEVEFLKEKGSSF
ncbi:MAG: DUF924 domain-containing protein [Bdellovibrionales bacterium]|nr:DUF924 domain-containing protein [Bdellovibrionales bacterium]